MNLRHKIILYITAAISVLVIIVCVFMGISSDSTRVFYEHVTEKDKNLPADIYSDEILKYSDLLSKDDTNVDAYLRLAEAYYMTGDLDAAIEVLEKGYEATGSMTLYLKKCDYEDERDVLESSTASMNDGLFRALADHKYSDYERNGIRVTYAGSDEVTARADNMNATLYFRNTDSQPSSVVNEEVKAGSYPAEIVLDDPMELFGGGKRLSFSRLQELGAKDARISTAEEYSYAVVFTYKECNVVIETTETGTVVSGASNRIIPKKALHQTDRKEDNTNEHYTVSCTVRSASQGQGLSNVHIQFVRKDNNRTQADAYTSGNGTYSVSVPKGRYTVVVSESGYADLYKSADVYGNMTLDLYLEATETSSSNTVSGTVTDSLTGSPVSAALLEFRDSRDSSLRASARTDSSGSYSLTLPSGSYSVSVSCEGYQAASQTLNVQGDTSFSLQLQADSQPENDASVHWVCGYVTNSETQEGITGAVITFTDSSGGTSCCTSESGGYFEACLEDGTYNVYVTCDGYRDGSDVILLETDIQLNFTLEVIGDNDDNGEDDVNYFCISGYVTDQYTGNVLAGAVVCISSSGAGDMTVYLSTDENGYFGTTIPEGQYLVTVQCSGYSPVSNYVDLYSDRSVDFSLIPYEDTDPDEEPEPDEVVPAPEEEITPELADEPTPEPVPEATPEPTVESEPDETEEDTDSW